MARLVFPNSRGGGWKPQTPDHRDKRLKIKKAPLPDQIYLEPKCLSVSGDQGEQGSCTGWAIKQAMEWSYRSKFGKSVELSAAFAYLQGRIIEASVKEDSGCEIRDVVKAVAKVGICLEKHLPYNASKLAVKASRAAIKNAADHQVQVGYYACRTVDDILQALNAGMPVDGGYSWFSNMSTAEFEANGVMRLPTRKDKLEGGHDNWFCGADLPSRMFLGQNSYSPSFGARHPVSGVGGFVLMPFDFVTKGLADDFWSILHE